MNHEIEKLKKRIDVAAKRTPADLVIKNGLIVNVFTREIIKGDIAITDGYIAGIGSYEGLDVADVQGKYVIPGFIDGHVHIESAMVPPSEFANVAVPHGVTTVIADPHEIGNVSGVEGIEFMIHSSEGLPLDVYIMLPSCVPATPFENAGAELDLQKLEPFFEHPRVLGLGEVMDFPAVLNNEEKMIAQLAAASSKGKCIDGHAAGLDADGLNVYMAAGIRTDHECVNAEEAIERLRKGMYVMLREGSAARDLIYLLKAVHENNARRFLFVTDDKHLDDLIREGSIDHNVRMAVKQGIDPILAIQIATLNAAECYNLKTKGAIAPGYEADILIVNDLESLEIERVYKKGLMVAEKGRMVKPAVSIYSPSPSIMNSINFKPFSAEQLRIDLGGKTRANIIGIVPNKIITEHIIDDVKLKNGLFQPCTDKDYLKIAVVERHKRTGNIGMGIVHGLGIKNGAIASTVAHDSHNIVASGSSDADLYQAIMAISDMGGGLAVVQNGNVIASLPLPIAGLMTDIDSNTVNRKLTDLNRSLKAIGCSLKFNPFLTLSFLALPVIPRLKITDIGLFDANKFVHIDVASEE